jgi:hypothetical protein
MMTDKLITSKGLYQQLKDDSNRAVYKSISADELKKIMVDFLYRDTEKKSFGEFLPSYFIKKQTRRKIKRRNS